ncbi:MAG: nucleotidyltransferase [Phycisphaerae bacterium]|nr:nucleotidyltransferase [Phycisphaerae bacterium]
MKPTLVILAAGMGSRYGGLKQLDSFGPSGETIMDYSVYDALRGGFGKVVFIIRPDMEQAFRETIGSKYEKHVPVAYAFQRLEALPDGLTPPVGRTKPWGTGHAVLAAADVVAEPFAVINADDFYGRSSFATLGEFLSRETVDGDSTYAMVGFTLRDTLSNEGSVNRGCCQCTSDGWLEKIVEIVNIERDGAGARYVDGAGATRKMTGDERVSMNTWGFRPLFFKQLRERFALFIKKSAGSEKAEFHLPSGVQEIMQTGQARVRVLPTSSRWVGVTHSEDKPRVTAAIRKLVDDGEYPEKLWG